MVIAETGRNRHQELLSDGNQTDGGEVYRDVGLDRESEIFFAAYTVKPTIIENTNVLYFL